MRIARRVLTAVVVLTVVYGIYWLGLLPFFLLGALGLFIFGERTRRDDGGPNSPSGWFC
jgi:hypothetical protein